jgi:hypothetical protein
LRGINLCTAVLFWMFALVDSSFDQMMVYPTLNSICVPGILIVMFWDFLSSFVYKSITISSSTVYNSPIQLNFHNIPDQNLWNSGMVKFIVLLLLFWRAFVKALCVFSKKLFFKMAEKFNMADLLLFKKKDKRKCIDNKVINYLN